ncbi:MAG: MerR family DNA-binding transcriptional regulator [Thiofilum sp.]|uniref:MerR family transcriptional regulator n=1 Tax=Thiofilum sp. TaxID=2212733 RepID=UPI0025FE3C85|nr:MerR family DNA-binding transcriptional regulator [Thiofilum sp.]MBK8452967.1 MerR family DNA-binding transcriptional regulator [Thiofilum sp.]
MEPRTYTISDLAKEYDVTPRAIRLYEELGLLAPLRDGSKRIYSDRDRVRLRLVLRAKRIGISLAEAKELFDLYDSNQLDMNSTRDRSGEIKQLKYLLSKLDERLESLKRQRYDVDMSIAEIERVYNKAAETLKTLEGTGLSGESAA